MWGLLEAVWEENSYTGRRYYIRSNLEQPDLQLLNEFCSESFNFVWFGFWHINHCRSFNVNPINVRGAFNNFPDFFVKLFKIVVDSWKFSMLLVYILWDDWPIFMISGSNEQLQQELEYTLLKPDCHCWWISKMQSDSLEERYAVKFCFNVGKMPQKHKECFRLLFDHLAWIEHQFFSGIKRFKEGRESLRDDEKCGRSKEVNTPELIGHRVSVRVTMLRF